MRKIALAVLALPARATDLGPRIKLGDDGPQLRTTQEPRPPGDWW